MRAGSFSTGSVLDPLAVLQFAEKTAARGRCGRRCRPPAPPAAGPRPHRNRGAIRAPSARAPTPRPCATACCASGTSTPLRRAARSRASASRFIHASVRTLPLAASWAIAGDEAVLVPGHFVQPVPGRIRRSAHSRTSMPRDCMYCLESRTVKSPKWNTLAASTASACPSSMPSARCSRVPTPPRGDDGHAHRIRHRAREREVEAVARAVAVHAGEQDFTRARLDHAARPRDRVQAGGIAAAVRVDLPGVALLFRVDGDHDALVADDVGGFADEQRILHRRGVDRNLVGARVQQPPHVLELAHAAAHRHRDEHLRRHRLDHVQDDVALVGARGDVEEGQLVRALAIVARGDFHRVARVAQADEIHALDDPPRGHVQAGDDALSEAHERPGKTLVGLAGAAGLPASRWPCRRPPAPS